SMLCFFFFQAEDGIRDWSVTGVQTCALPICRLARREADLDRIVAGESAIHPVRRRNAHRHRLLVGPSGAHGAKDLEREAQAVFRSEERRVGRGGGVRGGAAARKKRSAKWRGN